MSFNSILIKTRIVICLAGILQLTGYAVLYSQGSLEYEKYGCYAKLAGDSLVIGNQIIERTYSWNNGSLVSRQLRDKKTDMSINSRNTIPDLYLPGETIYSDSGNIEIQAIEKTPKWNKHIAINVTCTLNDLEVRRLFRIFPNTPAIQCTFFFRGKTSSSWIKTLAVPGEDLNEIQPYCDGRKGFSFAPVLEKVELPGVHWKVRSVRFFDVTDRYNTLVEETEELLYRENVQQGNLLLINSLAGKPGLFILKESPSWFSQLSYPGGDFLTSIGKVMAIGIGLDSTDLSEDEWIQGYGFVTGFSGLTELDALTALRIYQKNIRPDLDTYEPILIADTWGDRSQDKKISEDFLIKEIKACRRLGLNYLQIDDGWQKGLSSNSAFGGGTLSDIWDQDDYWAPHPQKFPRGLKPVLEEADRNNIRITLWYNPCATNSYENWEKEVTALTGFYHDFGVRIIKMDGLKIRDKTSEMRIRKIFDEVYENTGHEVIFNLDITADTRFGYHYFNEYGNYWVTNRYTDWRNYYPYTVLRNLWMLSKYLPPEKMQMVFMNIWRNIDRYGPDDPFAPFRVPFDYAFAVTMMSQPLAFLECSNLPEEAFTLKPVVEKYLEIQPELHSGVILPIGNEPNGSSWTGFQSILNNSEGYLLILRENNEQDKAEIKTWFPAGKRVGFIKVLGSGEINDQVVKAFQQVEVSLPEKHSWGLFKYMIK